MESALEKGPISIESLYLVSGRVCGDDDDTQHIVQASSQEAANSIFIEQLQSDCGGDEDTEVFVILSTPLEVAIAERLKEKESN